MNRMHKCMDKIPRLQDSRLDLSTIDWSLVRSFTAVMRSGNLTRAALTLKTTQPTVGRHIRRLETLVGEVLFDRVPEGLRPTARATELFEKAQTLDDAVTAFGRSLSGIEVGLKGTVRITTSHVFGSAVLPAILANLLHSHPALELELSLEDGLENLMRREADIAVRFSRPDQDDLIAVQIGTIDIGLFASRSYFARTGLAVPETPEQLVGHVVVGDEQGAQATAFAKVRRIAITKQNVRFRTASMMAQLMAVRAGIGIGPAIVPLARREQDLVRILPDISVAHLPVWIVAHDDLNRSARMRAVFDHLVEHVQRLLV